MLLKKKKRKKKRIKWTIRKKLKQFQQKDADLDKYKSIDYGIGF